MTALEHDIPERHRQILSTIIRMFIDTATPVGSRNVSKELDNQWSPATIRNVMADLEEQGLLDQPHLSAGRVPTTTAMRYWIEHLIEPRRPSAAAQRALRHALAAQDPKERLARLTGSLSELCHGAGIALVPRIDHGRLTRAELVPVGQNRLLLLWVTQRGVVYHRAIEVERPADGETIAKLEGLLNDEYRGHTFEEVRQKIRQDLRAMKHRFDALLEQLLLIDEFRSDDVILEGVGRVADQPDFADITLLKELYHAFEDRHELRALLDRVSRSGGMQVLLNEEAGLGTAGLGLVAAPYGQESQALGSIGVVGPARMAYPVVLGLVQYASDLLSQSFGIDGEPVEPG